MILTVVFWALLSVAGLFAVGALLMVVEDEPGSACALSGVSCSCALLAIALGSVP